VLWTVCCASSWPWRRCSPFIEIGKGGTNLDSDKVHELVGCDWWHLQAMLALMHPAMVVQPSACPLW
jgi:hypothetical protein